MKKIILILFLLPLFAVGQNRFEKEFSKADSAFWEQFKLESKQSAKEAATKTDSILYNKEKKLAIDNVLKVEGKDSVEACCSRSFYSCIYEINKSSKNKNILISEHDYLNEYMNGYMLGQLSFYCHKDFNYELLEIKLKRIKRELRKINNF